jgi:hypothetical protein
MPSKNAFGTPEGACFSTNGVRESASFVVDGGRSSQICFNLLFRYIS